MKPDEKTIDAAMLGDPEAAAKCTEARYAIPCPFCGKENPERGPVHYFGYELHNVHTGEKESTIILGPHTRCECGGWVYRSEYRNEALSTWNRRADLRRPVAEKQTDGRDPHEDEGNIEVEKAMCSFCGKPSRDARWLIAGPNCYICNECVALCSMIIMGNEETTECFFKLKTKQDKKTR